MRDTWNDFLYAVCNQTIPLFLPSLIHSFLASYLSTFLPSFSTLFFFILHSTLCHTRYEISPDPDRHYYSPATSQLLKSLTKLEHARQLQYLASQVEKRNNSCLLNTPSHLNRLASSNAEKSNSKGVSLDSVAQLEDAAHTEAHKNSMKSTQDSPKSESNPTSDKMTTTTKVSHFSDPISLRKRLDNDDVLQRPLIIIIRHGKTEHNKLGLFTGT